MIYVEWSVNIGTVRGSTNVERLVRDLTRGERDQLYRLPADKAFEALMRNHGGESAIDSDMFLHLAQGDPQTSYTNTAAVIAGLRGAKLLGPLSSLDEHAWNLGGDPANQPAIVTPELFTP